MVTKNKKILIFAIIVLTLFSISFILAQTFPSSNNPGFNTVNNNNFNTVNSNNFNTPSTNTFGTTNSNSFSSYDPNNFNSNNYRVFGSTVNPQFTDPSYTSYPYANNYNNIAGQNFFSSSTTCSNRNDFVLYITPGGCSPAVVTSDLLEEQNVPVFCKVGGLEVNPLFDVARIKSIRFKGDYPKGVSGVSYFPAKAALGSTGSLGGSTQLLSSRQTDNLGYLVIVLAGQKAEKDIPSVIGGNVTAIIDYDVNDGFGIGASNFYLSTINDNDWQANYKDYNFWNGKGYLRADSIDSDKATISVYSDVNLRSSTFTLAKGQTSTNINLNNFYCAAGLTVRLVDIGAPVESALLQINDKQVWVSKGDTILNNRCRVSDLSVQGSGGKVSINCPVKDGNFDLSLTPGGAVFNSQSYTIGSRISGNVYLAYAGQDSNSKKYSVLINDSFSDTDAEFADKQIYTLIGDVVSKNGNVFDIKKIEDAVVKQYILKLKKSDSDIRSKIQVKLVGEGDSEFGTSLDKVDVAQDVNYDVNKLTERQNLALEYYEKAMQNYNNLASYYPKEVDSISGETYSAQGLLYSAELSKNFGMNSRAQQNYDKLKSTYPGSSLTSSVEVNDALLNKYDTKNSKASVVIGTDQYLINLLDFRKPSKADLSAALLVNGKENNLGLNEIVNIGSGNVNGNIQLIEIKDDYVSLKYDPIGRGSYRIERINLNGQTSVNGVDIKLIKINLNKQAKVSLDSSTFANGLESQSQFNFKIGVEKRAIQLSPNKTREIMDNLQKSINSINKVTDKLGETIKAMKAACFATAGVLTAKSFLNGLSGESIARSAIMTKPGGWNEKCGESVNGGKYSTIQECLLANSGQIDNDVKIYSDEITKTNKVLEDIRNGVGVEHKDVLDFQGNVDAQKVDQQFNKVFYDFCKNSNEKIQLPDKDSTTISLGSDVCGWNNMTLQEKRDIMTLVQTRNAGGSDVLTNTLNKDLGKVTLEARDYNSYLIQSQRVAQETSKYNLGLKPINPVGDSVTLGDIKTLTGSDLNNPAYKNYKQGDSVVRVFVPAKQGNFAANADVADQEVIVPVKNDGKGVYRPDTSGSIYTVDGTKLNDVAAASARDYMNSKGISRIRQSSNKEYENQVKDPTKLSVKYFETAPYKGLPAEVPFDVDKGWYAEMSYVLSGFGTPYDQSGRVVNFYICNVGANGLIEFKQSSDDICRYYNSANPVLDFPGMSSGESSVLVSRAQKAISDAARQYGKDHVVINGKSFKSATSFGGGDGSCTDFMSPSDCHLLFNVCDPVICPSSRCDLGGRFKVDNVVQTGVIGSLLLCLPNARDGIAIPICLTGVNAGLQGYASILNSTVNCLNESIQTGRNVGICDEIKSIYLCEFFWKQAGPFIDVLVPKLFEGVYGQNVKGGGEYLTVQNAWDNTQGAINYFKNNYAVNALNAFSLRSAADVGSQFCNSFNSVAVPTNADLLDRLLEPDSPVQYSGWFSEDQLSTATVPPISHYKVYYHIFAGKDYGTQYSVYLKNNPGTSAGTGVYINNYYTVSSGYIPVGNQVDEARDFTGSSGYKQLCINVNGREECGFGQVSTSYLLNSISDSYAASQINTNIKSERECIAGSPSLLSAAQPNLQSGVSQIVDPALYNKGIVRICASENPGKKVTPSGTYDRTNSTFDRWQDTGYCDDPKIRCWLDTNSVKDVIKDKQIESSVLNNVNLNVLGQIDYLSEEESTSILNNAEDFTKNLDVRSDTRSIIETKIGDMIFQLQRVTTLAAVNTERAKGFLLIGNLYRKISLQLWTDPNANSASSFNTNQVNSPSDIVVNSASANAIDSLASSIVYEFDDGTSAPNIFYKYDNGWKWSFTRQNWISVSNIDNYIDQLQDTDKVFMSELVSEDYSSGVASLLKRTTDNNEGGFFYSSSLSVYIKNSKLQYRSDNALLKDSGKFIEFTNSVAK